MSNMLQAYCGSCHKPVATIKDKEDLSVIYGSLKNCPKCGKPCVQNDQVVLRDPVMDEVFVARRKPKPPPQAKPANPAKYPSHKPVVDPKKPVNQGQGKE